jgi:hypothetical protein
MARAEENPGPAGARGLEGTRCERRAIRPDKLLAVATRGVAAVARGLDGERGVGASADQADKLLPVA